MNAVSNAKDEHLATLLAEADDVIGDAKRYLYDNGKTYDLSEWVTVKEYAKRHNLESTSVVSNWMARGIISPNDIRVFAELNGLRLIRNKAYK